MLVIYCGIEIFNSTPRIDPHCSRECALAKQSNKLNNGQGRLADDKSIMENSICVGSSKNREKRNLLSACLFESDE